MVRRRNDFLSFLTSQSFHKKAFLFFLFSQYVSANVVDVKDNYSVVVENDLINGNSNEKVNVSILCPITRIGLLGLLLMFFFFSRQK